MIDGMALNQAINFLKNADRIYLAGVGASSLPAQDEPINNRQSF